jgi:cysteine synthase
MAICVSARASAHMHGPADALRPAGAIEAAEKLCAVTPDSFCLGQFQNPANPDIHYRTTGPEIWQDTAGRVAYLVVGVGTGGTLSGAGRYLKERNPNVKVVAVEPRESPVLRGGRAGSHGIAGIGAGFIPPVLDVRFSPRLPVTCAWCVLVCTQPPRKLLACRCVHWCCMSSDVFYRY